jgi:hypothetical protein
MNNKDGNTLVQMLSVKTQQVSKDCLEDLRQQKILIARMLHQSRKAIASGVATGMLFCATASGVASLTSEGRDGGAKMFFIGFLSLGVSGYVAEVVINEKSSKELAKINYLLDNLKD